MRIINKEQIGKLANLSLTRNQILIRNKFGNKDNRNTVVNKPETHKLI